MSAQPAPRQAPVLAITDHALLRWMERAHGIDVDTWRRLCREDADDALASYDGAEAIYGPAFLVTGDGRVLTYVNEGAKPLRANAGTIAVPAPNRS